MPESHLLARREQILDAAARTFADRGFQATGMAEVIAASGMSAGAVYRYFRGKDELIAAIVDRVLQENVSRLDEELASGRSLGTAGAVGFAVDLVHDVATSGPFDFSRLAVQAWAEALHNPGVSAVARRVYGRIRAFFAEVVEREVDAGRLPRDLDVHSAAAALMSMVVGFMLQRLVLGDVEPGAYGRAVAGLLR